MTPSKANWQEVWKKSENNSDSENMSGDNTLYFGMVQLTSVGWDNKKQSGGSCEQVR